MPEALKAGDVRCHNYDHPSARGRPCNYLALCRAGLHRESLAEAEEQLRLLVTCLPGRMLPASLALMQGQIEDWLSRELGLTGLLPSVRCGLEGALLSALAHAHPVLSTLPQLLCAQQDVAARETGVRLLYLHACNLACFFGVARLPGVSMSRRVD